MELSRQENWGGLSFPSPGDLSDAGIKPGSSALQADSLASEPPGKPHKSHICLLLKKKKVQKNTEKNKERKSYHNHSPQLKFCCICSREVSGCQVRRYLFPIT